MSVQSFYIKVEWDAEAKVWFIDSTNIPGLNVEAESREELLSILDEIVPVLLMANGVFDEDHMLPAIPYSLMFNQLQAAHIVP